MSVKQLFSLALLVGSSLSLCAQQKALPERDSVSIFDKISRGISDFKPDTTAPPNDKFTQAIITLRNLRGGFNISEAIEFKLEEDRRKEEVPAGEMEKLTHFFTRGNGKRWLDHAVIWIYRNHFTYQEIKELTRFYKSSAGQKMADQFPIIMLQSLAAAEMIKSGMQPAQQNK